MVPACSPLSREYKVVGLLTTFNEAVKRVAMHAVRRERVEHQAFAAGLPLWPVYLPWPCSNEQYEALMVEACSKAINNGIEGIAFGDLFLEDVRTYREKQLKGTGLEPIFPLWGQPTHELAQRMIRSGLRARLTCVDTKQLEAEFVGREFDEDLLTKQFAIWTCYSDRPCMVALASATVIIRVMGSTGEAMKPHSS